MKYMKMAVFVLLIVVLTIVGVTSGAAEWVANGEFAYLLHDLINRSPVEATLFYFFISIIGCAILALPGVVFALTAGAFFGPVWGTLLCWVSMSVGACVSFLMGKYFLQDAIKPKLEKNTVLNKVLYESIDKSDLFLLAVTRLVPLFPFNLQNFAYGITDMRFAPYAVYSTVFIFPGTATYTLIAAGVIDPNNRLTCLVVAAALIVVSLGVAYPLKRKAGI